MSFFPTKRVFALGFSLDSCRAGMNLNLTFISAPGTIVHYDCVYYVYVYSMSCIFAFDLFLQNHLNLPYYEYCGCSTCRKMLASFPGLRALLFSLVVRKAF